MNFQEKIQDIIITAEQLFIEKSKIELTEKQLKHFINGVLLTRTEKNDIYRIYDGNSNFIGLGEIKNGKLKREYIQ